MSIFERLMAISSGDSDIQKTNWQSTVQKGSWQSRHERRQAAADALSHGYRARPALAADMPPDGALYDSALSQAAQARDRLNRAQAALQAASASYTSAQQEHDAATAASYDADQRRKAVGVSVRFFGGQLTADQLRALESKWGF